LVVGPTILPLIIQEVVVKLIGSTKNGVSLCVRYLAVIYLGIQIMGCGALVKHYASVPDENTPGASFSGGYVGNDIITFSRPDLDLAIQVQNHLDSGFSMFAFIVPVIPIWEREEQWEEGRYLILWVDIAPKDNNNTFSFDPGRVTLKFDDGTNVQVKEFVGPFKPWISPRAVVRGCGRRRYSFGVETSRTVVGQEDIKTPHGSIPIPFEKKSFWRRYSDRGHSCFLLGFNADGSPDRSFVLSIEGIEKSGAQYPVPEIRFKKGSIWKLYPLP
jgi:hypothetical protein